MRIHHKLTLAIVVAVAATLSAHGFLRVRREVELFQDDIRRDHRVLGHALAIAVAVVAARSGRDEALAFLEDTNLREGRLEIRWVDGTTVRTLRSELVPEGEHGALVTRVPASFPGGRGSIELHESLASQAHYLRASVIRVVVAALVTIILCAVVCYFVGWLVVGKPMEQLVAKLRRMGDGDLGGPLALTSGDEMSYFAHELNATCDRLALAKARVEEETAARIAALEQLRHAERLSTLGRLASGLAHELGTPLNVVAARAKMIERGESEGDEIPADARVIREQADRMTSVIRQILGYARRPVPRKDDTDMASLARSTVALLEPLASRHGVALAVDADRAAHAYVDAGQMQQVLTNLTMNAIQAQPEGGQVEIRVASRGRSVRVEVTDAGPGIPEEIRTRLFEPFFTTKEAGEGTGLGLSVAQGLAEEHGARIDVVSASGTGTTFAFEVEATSRDPEGVS